MNTEINPRVLRTFIEVANRSSMRQAAVALGYVPSAVSHHIASLEEAMSVRLFDRSPGSRLSLTAAGRALVSAARQRLDAEISFRDVASSISDGLIEELRVGAFPSALAHLVVPVLPQISRIWAGTRVDVIELETPRGLPLVVNGEVDLLLAYRYLHGDPPHKRHGLTERHVGVDPLMLVTAVGMNADLSECLELDWVSGHQGNGDRRMLEQWSAKLGVAPRLRYQVEDSHIFLSLVKSGLAVGLLPRLVAADAIQQGVVDTVQLPDDVPHPSRDILALTRSSFQPALVNELLSRVRDLLALTAHAPQG